MALAFRKRTVSTGNLESASTATAAMLFLDKCSVVMAESLETSMPGGRKGRKLLAIKAVVVAASITGRDPFICVPKHTTVCSMGPSGGHSHKTGQVNSLAATGAVVKNRARQAQNHHMDIDGIFERHTARPRQGKPGGG